jgi:hypothetical protein
MADDSFIREVDEELRQDQMKAFWQRYGKVLIGVAVLVVLGTAGWNGYRYWIETEANSSGDQFIEALDLAKAGNQEDASKKHAELERDGFGAYPALARLRQASLDAEAGKTDQAVSGFDAASNDHALPQSLRDLASLRAAYLLIDSGSYDDVAKRAETLTAEGNPMRFSAQEALGLAAWKAGKFADALKIFDAINGEAQTPANLRHRANLMAELIRGSGKAS